MKLVEFEEQTAVFAKDHPEFLPLPAHINRKAGIVTCCWELTFWEKIKLLSTGKIWHQIITYNEPLQPQLLHIKKPI